MVRLLTTSVSLIKDKGVQSYIFFFTLSFSRPRYIPHWMRPISILSIILFPMVVSISCLTRIFQHLCCSQFLLSEKFPSHSQYVGCHMLNSTTGFILCNFQFVFIRKGSMQNQKIHVCLWFGKFYTIVRFVGTLNIKSLRTFYLICHLM